MAALLGISTRTLSRWLVALQVSWPPVPRDEWRAILAQAAQDGEPETPARWLVVCTLSAANLTELEERYPDITILRVARLSNNETDSGHSELLS